MNFILFAIIYTLIGITIIYFYGKLPKAITTFVIVFFAFSFLYWGAVILDYL